ncbi:MAG: HDOD domain-containing protein [Candidatus Desulfofervidaceae bacterium]|nr:HDOD domain-containing protein [Candidatus Desulfofervidaceae bacterium]
MNGEISFFLSPGELYISSEPNAVIETYLGSCIGVALYDPIAQVGGMAHIVLPEGNKDKEANAPAKYARSGIPYLIEEMLKKGATREHLEAKIAGGASIVQDTGINVGQRNIAKVREVLSQENIPVLEEDVGGNFGRVFRLYIKDGSVEVRFIGQKLREAALATLSPVKEEVTLRLLLQKISQLKPMSKTMQRVLSVIESDPFSIEEIKKEIYQDQALTVNILKICNSPYYGFAQRVANLSQGIVLLGLNTVKRILLSLSFKNILTPSINGYSLKQGEFFKHALGCAFMAELIAKEKQYPEPEIVFTAGLLHDVGKIILDQVAADKFHLVMRKVLKEKMSFLDAEKETLGYTHPQVGEMVAKQWHLPEVLIEAIAYHHTPEQRQEAPAVVAMVHIADAICRLVGIGCGAAGLTNPIHPQALTLLKLKGPEIDSFIEKVPEIIKQIQTFEAA